jgi:diaminobutyrate-2-oxoglutarate transaminase
LNEENIKMSFRADGPFEHLNYPEAPHIIVTPPGPKARELLERQRLVDSAVLTYPRSMPLAPVEGLGATLRDADGNVFIDLSGGVGVLNAGHSHPEVVTAVVDQAGKLTHMLDFPAPTRLELSEKLVSMAPGELAGRSRVFLCGPTGSDAVEAAVKLAKAVSRRPTVISFEGGWHGVSGVGMAATGKRGVRQGFLPVMPEVYHAPYAYCYRCRFGLHYPECGLQCARFLEHVVRDPDSGATDPGCVLIEPIQGEGGVVVPPPEYLREVRRICDAYDLLLIIDEIQTGFGRAGAMFACELAGVTPDILCISKTMGGGLPLAAIIMREELDVWAPGSHVGTFRGNLLASAAGLAAIEVLEREELAERSARLGRWTLERLQQIAEGSRFIGEVRGQGLFIGIEFVRDRQSKEPAPDILQALVEACFERGVMLWKAGRSNSVGRIMPALVITERLLETALDVFEESYALIEQRR